MPKRAAAHTEQMSAAQVARPPQTAAPVASSAPASADPERDALQKRVKALEVEVLSLQKKLDALHATDVNDLRRAYTTLRQHVQALDIESKHIATLVSGFGTEVITPQFVAQEVGIVASATASVWVVDRTLKWMQVPLSRMVTRAAIGTVVGLVSLRLIRTTCKQFSQFFKRNRVTKDELEADWQIVRQRIEIMAQLSQPNMPAMT